MNAPRMTRSLAPLVKSAQRLAMAMLVGGLCLAPPQADAAMIFDDASVKPTRFFVMDGNLAISLSGLKLSLRGLHLPGDPTAPPRALAFEVVRIGTDAETVAIALTASDTGLALAAAQLATQPGGETPRMVITTDDAKNGRLATKLAALDPQGRAVMATICATMADPANLSAALAQLAQTDRPAPEGLFQTAVLSLATQCTSALAEIGTTSAGFISRDQLSARLLQGADGILSANSIVINNWTGNNGGARMTGSIVSLLGVTVAGNSPQDPPKGFAATSLLWDGPTDDPSQRRLALYGRVAQYQGSVSGLFDAEDNLTVDLFPGAPLPEGLDAAIVGSSRESLLLVEHALSNLPLLRAATLESSTRPEVTINGSLSKDAANYWSAAAFGDDLKAVLDQVRAELFRRAYPDEKAVSKLQESLKAWRLYDGDVDGQTGPMTRAAFAAFERIVSGAANGTPSELETAALALWSDGPTPSPPPLKGSLADALTADQPQDIPAELAATLQGLETEATGILAEIAALETELANQDAETTPRIREMETLLIDCYCQGGRLCP